MYVAVHAHVHVYMITCIHACAYTMHTNLTDAVYIFDPNGWSTSCMLSVHVCVRGCVIAGSKFACDMREWAGSYMPSFKYNKGHLSIRDGG